MERALVIVSCLASGTAIAAPCPGLPAALGAAAPTTDVPTYDRTAWLVDSAATADLVVVGTPGKTALAIDRIVCGAPDKALGDATHVTIGGPRFVAEHGVWILTKTVGGYYATNPELHAVTEPDWQAIAATLPARDPQPVDERIDNAQILRTYAQGDKTINHGTSLWTEGDTLVTQLWVHDVRVVMRTIDRDGLRSIYVVPAQGHGFSLDLDRGRLRSFTHYLDGKEDGLAQRRYDSGGLREEFHYRRGVRHGVASEWTEAGALRFRQTYEDGLAGKVVRFTGKRTGGATISRGPDRVMYAAPEAVLARIRVGMTAAQLSDVVQVDFSETDGLWFPDVGCEWGLNVTLAGGRVAAMTQRPNGAFCE